MNFCYTIYRDKEREEIKMTKAIYFDMDGTIANFYGVEGWLSCLESCDAYPYEAAAPLLRLSALAKVLNRLQRNGYKINIISWLAKNSTPEFDEKVTEIKKMWLKKHLSSVKWDKITIVPYGVDKSTLGNGVLFDDEENNRNMWGENAYDVHNILDTLKSFS